MPPPPLHQCVVYVCESANFAHIQIVHEPLSECTWERAFSSLQARTSSPFFLQVVIALQKAAARRQLAFLIWFWSLYVCAEKAVRSRCSGGLFETEFNGKLSKVLFDDQFCTLLAIDICLSHKFPVHTQAHKLIPHSKLLWDWSSSRENCISL